MSRPLRPAIALAAIALAALTLSSCQLDWLGGGTGGSGGSAGGSSNSSTAPGLGTEAEGELTAGSDCPVGDWTLVNESWAESLGAFFVAEGMSLTKAEVSGELHLNWKAGGDYVLDARASQYDFSGISEGQPFAFRVTHDGTETGTWTENGSGAWRLTGQETGGVTSVVSLGESEAGLVTVDQGVVTPDAWEGLMTVTCTSTGMTTVATEDAGTVSVDWVPRRR
jgi:hypothetical protein